MSRDPDHNVVGEEAGDVTVKPTPRPRSLERRDALVELHVKQEGRTRTHNSEQRHRNRLHTKIKRGLSAKNAKNEEVGLTRLVRHYSSGCRKVRHSLIVRRRTVHVAIIPLRANPHRGLERTLGIVQ